MRAPHGGSSVEPNLTSLADIRRLLAALGVRPNRVLGQNFLVDRNILGILIDLAELSRDDGVLEIGAGLGVLTEQLVRRAGRVVTVEKDRALASYLAERFKSAAGLTLMGRDALELNLGALLADGLNKVVANLPYSVGTRILVDLMRAAARPALLVVTVQKEVAARMAAQPGGRDHGLLSIWTQMDYEIEIPKTISRTCFWPPPDIESAIVRCVRRMRPFVEEDLRSDFYDVTRQVYMHRRKQMASLLRTLPAPRGMPRQEAEPMLESCGIAPTARPETLTLAQWRSLVAAMHARSQPA